MRVDKKPGSRNESLAIRGVWPKKGGAPTEPSQIRNYERKSVGYIRFTYPERYSLKMRLQSRPYRELLSPYQ